MALHLSALLAHLLRPHASLLTVCWLCVSAAAGKVMCTGCLCTGKQFASEHDPRIDPFQ